MVAGAGLLIIEGEERPLRRWDFVHCPPGTNHAIVAAENSSCLVLAVGARERSVGPGWGAYTVDEAALRHNAGVAEETNDAKKAYAALGPREPISYREGWLPE